GRAEGAAPGRAGRAAWPWGRGVDGGRARGEGAGLAPGTHRLEAGLLSPLLPPAEGRRGRLVSFDHWLGTAGSSGAAPLAVFSPPQIAARAMGVELGLPDLAETADLAGPLSPVEADGLEWPLRLGVLWQQVAAAPLRRTQGG